MIKIFQDLVDVCVSVCMTIAMFMLMITLMTGKMPQNMAEVTIGLGETGDKIVKVFYSGSKLFVDHIKTIVENN